jgi:peptidoglycan hydrolase-like protein with peptidoglycan-binding domain
LQGGATLGFSENGIELTGFEATTLLSLPDQSLLEQVLRRSLPNLGAIRGTAQLAWAGDWIMLRSAEAEMQALERLQLKAEGRIGKLSGESFAFDLVPRIDLSAAVDHSPPLVYLIEELVKEAGSTVGSTSDPSAPATPQQATSGERNLVLLIQHGLEAAGLGPGRLDGKAGPRTRAAIEEYQARHGLPVDGQASKELLRHLEETVDLALAQTPPSFSPTPSQISRLAASLPELGPVTAALQVSRDNAAYHLDALNLSSGAMGAPQIEVTGTLGVLRPEGDPPLEDIALQVSFAVPSSQAFAQVFSPHVPDFTDVRGRFDLQGTVQELSISNVRLTARGPDGLAVTVNGRVAKLSAATGFSPEDLALDLDARWPNSESVYGFVDLDLPELGPVWARATLRDSGEIFRLTGIDVTVGSEEQPAVLIAGEVGDVLAFEEVKLSGVVDVATVTLLESEVETRDARLGTIHGRFDLSDRDGSLGLEALSAEVEDTKLLSLSVVGLFDDIERGDDLRLEASLTVPDVSRLVQELGYEAEPLGSLSFEGEVSGSDERFRAEGEARIGETNLTGTLSGTLTGDRPALRAKLYSPLFRFADVGLVPQQDEAHAPWEPETQPGKDEPGQGKIFGETPIPFEALRQIDLDLDVLFDDLEGVHLDIDNAEARLNLVEGMLRVDPLSFNFVGGRVELTLEIDGK